MSLLGGDVEENVDFHNVQMGSLGFKKFPVAKLKKMSIFLRYKWLHWGSKHFVGAMLMNMAIFEGYNCIQWGSQVAVKFTQLQSIGVPV